MAKGETKRESVELTDSEKEVLLKALSVYGDELTGLAKKTTEAGCSLNSISDKQGKVEELKNKLL